MYVHAERWERKWMTERNEKQIRFSVQIQADNEPTQA